MTERHMTIALKRVYDEPAASDGMRVLVERLWPRGLSKERAHIDLWLKDVAPGPNCVPGLAMTRRNLRSFAGATKRNWLKGKRTRHSSRC